MKKLMLSTAILAVSGFATLAQDADTMFRTKADPMEIRASELIGKRVYASEAAIEAGEYQGVQEGWEDIGEINDVILGREGSAEAVLVDIGGFLGMGEHQVAVSMSGLRFVSDTATPDDLDDYLLVMNAPRGALEAAPTYMSDNAAAVDAQTTEAAEAVAEAERPLADSPDEVIAESTGADMTTAETDAAEGTPTDMAATEAPADAPAREVTVREGWVVAAPDILTSERLTGAAAYDSTDAKIGDVANLVMNDQGQVTQVVIDVGGFLGMGEKPVALSLDEIDILQEDGGETVRVYVPMTKEQMEALPAYES